MNWNSEDTLFRVMVNHREQYSIWPDYLDIPNGWREIGVSGTRQYCLDHISEVWTTAGMLARRPAIEQPASPPPAAETEDPA